jgi:hypothetical protein
MKHSRIIPWTSSGTREGLLEAEEEVWAKEKRIQKGVCPRQRRQKGRQRLERQLWPILLATTRLRDGFREKLKKESNLDKLTFSRMGNREGVWKEILLEEERNLRQI